MHRVQVIVAISLACQVAGLRVCMNTADKRPALLFITGV